MTLAAVGSQRRIDELESLRGLAAIMVVFFHVPKWLPFLNTGVIVHADLMVELFFVLSGFVMLNAYAGRISSARDLLRFQFLRFGRVYPLHLLFLLIFLVIECVKLLLLTQRAVADIRLAPFAENTPTALLEQLFLLQAIGPTGNALTFNYPAWSISAEFYTYLIFGLVLLLGGQPKARYFLLLATAALALLLSGWGLGFDYLLRCVAGFFTGCLVAQSCRRRQVELPPYASAFVLLALLAFLQFKQGKTYDVVVYPLAAALIATLVLAPRGWLNRLLKLDALTWLGARSYAIYMSHAFVLWLFALVLKRLLKRPEIVGPNGMVLFMLTPVEAWFVLSLFFACVLAVSEVVHMRVEKPWRERSRDVALTRLK